MNKLSVLIIFILFIAFAYALTFEDKAQGDFSGIFNNTFYNSSGFIQLNNSINGTSVVGNTTEHYGDESGLISYWRFNESSWTGAFGEVKDVLGRNNGTVPSISTANTTDGKFGRAGNFSGVSGAYTNEVQVSSSAELNPENNSFTITGWAKSSQRGGTTIFQLYVAKRTTSATNGFYVGMLEGSGLNFMIGDGTNRYDTRDTAYVPVNYDEWFHFAAVINRTSKQILLYKNGTLAVSRSFTTLNNITNTANLSIGNDEGQAQAGFNYPVKGQVDELAIWNRALNSSEILSLYQNGNATNSTVNGTEFYSGTYESNVKDAGSIVSWENISWNGLVDGSLGELPNNKGTDSGANMSGNVLLMHMNEESGIIEDFSGEENNGTENGGIIYASSGKYYSSLTFDGSNDYISISHDSSLNLGNVLTIEAWVYPTSLSNRYAIYSTRRNNPAGSFQLEIGTGNSHTNVVVVAGVNTWVVESENNAVNLNQWNHIVYTRNGTGTGNHKVYVNGQEKTLQTTSSYDFADNTDIKMIGAGTILLAMHYFPGRLDEVAVYNRPLSSQEVLNHYNRNGTSSNLKFQLRTSNDNLIWSDYEGSNGTSSSYYEYPQELNFINSKYIQYKTYFDAVDDKLYNVTLNYDNSTSSSVLVTLDSPVDNYLTNEYNINITCSASSISQLSNITPYYDKFGWAPAEPARSISGTTNTTTFTLSEITSSVLWNCYACNIDGNCSFASSNKTIIGDILAPTINSVSPAESYMENSSSIINFIFNAADSRAASLDCKLLVNDSESASNSSVISGANTTFSVSLPNGNHRWKINCSDGANFGVSEERNLTINILISYTPFWAKTNTHTHTTNSDGDSSPTTVVNLYKSKSYSILAITDHGYVTNCTPFTNLSEPFLCINSEEWTSTKHVVRINVSAPYNNAALNLQNAVNAANNEGGFAIVAHPNWSSTIWSVSDLTSLQNYTAMEIYNKVIERSSPDPYAVLKWDEVLKTGKKIFGVAADDMHQVNVDLGYGWTKVYMPEFTKQAYIDSMRTGYFYASQGPNMDSGPFTLTCDSAESFHMGETANCSVISVSSTISATNSSFIMKNISLIKDGNTINLTNCSSQNCTLAYSENVFSSGYYRVQGFDNRSKQIWSNPIWVNKIALPVTITLNAPENNSITNDYTPLLNISLNQQTYLWYNMNGNSNITLCSNCSSYSNYISLAEGSNWINVYANNSDNIIKSSSLFVSLDFNKSSSDEFNDNSSISTTDKIFWNNDKMSLNAGEMFGNFILKPLFTDNNITSFTITWTENNTAGAMGEGQRAPIILKYKINNSGWIYTDSDGDYIFNDTTISGLNGNNLSLMFDFEKNNETPIDLLSFRIIWTEFTIPLISNVSKSSVTSSSAVISWHTDLVSNSSVLYGTTSSLSQFSSLNDSVTTHSITLTGLLASQGYSFRVVSCTDSSCSQYPQDPYTPDSFTTQAVSSSSSNSSSSSGGGGSSSGGGGGGSISAPGSVNKILEAGQVSDIVVNAPGVKKILSWKVRNIGRNFLNDCKFKSSGALASWITKQEIKGFAAGEEYEFVFDVNIPENTATGKYNLGVALNCKEATASEDFSVEITERQLAFNLISAEREGKNKVNVVYSIEELVGKNQEVNLQFLLFDSTNKKVAEFEEIKEISASSTKEFESLIPIDETLSGDLILLINFNSKTYSGFVKENIVLGSSISGLTILDRIGGTDNIVSGLLILLFLGFAVFVVIRIKGHKRKTHNKVREMIHKNWRVKK